MTVELGVEVAFGYGTAHTVYAYYNINRYDDGTLYAPDVLFESLDDRVRGEERFTCSRGARQMSGSFARVEAGSASCTLNNRDRALDPTDTSGPYVLGGLSQVVPGVKVRFVATVDGIRYVLLTGRADGWPQNYVGGADQTVTLEASDAVKDFAVAQFTTTRSLELSGTRIRALLAKANWPSTLQTIDDGLTEIPALTDSTVSVWSMMSDVAEAEWGAVYVDEQNVVHFDDRNQILTNTRSAISQATFGNDPGELPYADVGIGYDTDLIFNDVTLVYNDQGSTESVEDATSQDEPWGVQSWNRALPMASRNFAATYATWIATLFGYPAVRFTFLVLEPNNDTEGDLFQYAFGLQLGDRITVKLTPLGGGARIERDCWIRGISHEGQGDYWRTTWVLEDASWTENRAFYDQSSYDDGSIYAL